MTSTDLFPTGFGSSMIGLGPAVVRMGRWTAGSVWALALALGLMVLWRRMGGDTLGAVPWSAGLLSGVLAAAVAAGTRVLWLNESAADRPPALPLVHRGWPTLVPLCWALALAVPPVTGAALAGFALPVLLEELWAWGWTGRPRRWEQTELARARPTDPTSPAVHRARSEVATAVPPLADQPPVDGEVLEQLTRCRSADGAELVTGYLTARFERGQRTESVHVAFCPPLPRVPEVRIEQLEGPTARIKIGQLQTFGVRVDLKLAETAGEPQRVLLRLSARAELRAE